MRWHFLCLVALCGSVVVGAVPGFGYHYAPNALSDGDANGNGHGRESSSSSSFFNSHTALNHALAPPAQHAPATSGGDRYLPPAANAANIAAAAPIITKQFFLVSAPEEPEETPKTKHFVLGRAQRNYRVVFIKAPATENNNIKLTAEYAPQEEKTVIYVLSKKANDVDIGEIVQPPPTQPTKPDVFFIKYRTPEEAAAAQKEIQDQYDYLGGSSQYSDEGTAPIKSVIGSLDGPATNVGYDYKKPQIQTGLNVLQPMRFYY